MTKERHISRDTKAQHYVRDVSDIDIVIHTSFVNCSIRSAMKSGERPPDDAPAEDDSMTLRRCVARASSRAASKHRVTAKGVRKDGE